MTSDAMDYDYDVFISYTTSDRDWVSRELLGPLEAAGLRAAGIHGSDGEIRRVAASYGNHPLSLAILAGWIAEDLKQPGDIAAAQRLTITNDLVQNRHHVLEATYQSLSLPGVCC
jgi:hypothetical protein